MKKEKIYLVRLPLVCNFNCLFCFLEKKDTHQANFWHIINQIEDAKTQSNKVVFSGGEPTLIKELPIFIKYAKAKKIKEVEIQTNALRCADENYVKKLKNVGLNSVLVGFHSHQEKKFNLLTQTRGFFPKVLKGIHNLFKYKISVSFNHTITTLTYRDLEDYVKFIVKNFPKPKNIFLTLVYPCGQCWKHKELIPRASEVAPYFLKALQYCQQENIKVLIPHCGMPGFPLCLLAQKGKNNLEELISSGRKNIKSKEFNCVNLKPKSCQNCRYDKICIGIAYNYKKLYGLKEFKPVR